MHDRLEHTLKELTAILEAVQSETDNDVILYNTKLNRGVRIADGEPEVCNIWSSDSLASSFDVLSCLPPLPQVKDEFGNVFVPMYRQDAIACYSEDVNKSINKIKKYLGR